jgi:uncharacterized membrane protein
MLQILPFLATLPAALFAGAALYVNVAEHPARMRGDISFALAQWPVTSARPVGLALCIFLLLILPSNVYAAFQRVDFRGHGAGPIYLLVRVPLQFFLIG